MFYISEKHKKTPLPHSNHVPAVPVEQSNETLNQVALLSKGIDIISSCYVQCVVFIISFN